MRTNTAKIIRNTLLIFSLAYSLTTVHNFTYAQRDTVYNESVIVNVGFNPIVTDANKITENPGIFDTSFSQINLSFEKIDKGYATHLAFDTIKAAQVKGEPVAKLYNFNIKGGLGMALSKQLGNGFTPMVQASYSSLRNRRLLYGADIYSRSVIGQQKDYGYAGYSNNDLNLWAKRIFDNEILTGRAFYNYNRHYYYGDNLFNEHMDLNTQQDAIKKKDYRTAYHNIGMDLVYKRGLRENSFRFNSLVGVNYTASKLKSKELDLHAMLDGNKTVKFFGNTEQTLGMTFDYRHAFRKYKGSWDSYQTTGITYPFDHTDWLFDEWDNMDNYSQGRALFNFSPYFIFDYQKFHFFASLAFIPKINGYNSFQILPTATISFELIQNILSLYGGFKSEAKLPSLYELTKENPFLSASIRLQDEANENLFVKFITTISPNAQLSLEGGLTEMRNYHFFYNLPIAAKPVYNTMNIDYANAKRYYALLETHFNLSNSFNLNLNATFQNIKRNDDVTAWYCPKFIASMKATYKYDNRLFVTLTPTFKSKQKARYILDEYNLKATVDINLEASYQYNDNWSFFIDLENLAFQKYQRYYYYPVYSFIGMLGAAYRF
ncbi:MAG: hypothetical protein J6M30_00580 [Bacteroidales bacterium]|nr:hypothetical protein [Bacteroidales bacterium]